MQVGSVTSQMPSVPTTQQSAAQAQVRAAAMQAAQGGGAAKDGDGDHGVEPTGKTNSAPTGTGLLLNAKA